MPAFVRPLLRFSLWLVAISLWTSVLSAQVDTSVIGGSINDKSGAAISSASVTISNLDSQVVINLQTNDSGRYTSPPLKPGRYRVSAEATNFQKVEATLVLEVGQPGAANLVLPVRSGDQSVTVTAEVSQIAAESSSVGLVRNNAEIRDLPINQRNAVRVIEMTPGTVPNSVQAQLIGVTNYRGIAQATVNGQNSSFSNPLLDGINNVDNHAGGATVILPLIDSIAEMRVINTGADAQYGRTLGGVINVVLKSGGKQFHGTAFEYARNSGLDAKNYFTPKGSPQSFSQNQFGGSIGGPLFIPHFYNTARNKTFFFGDYQGTRRNQAAVNTSTLPLPAMVKGDFSSLLPNVRIFDPVTGQPFSGNIIPSNRFNTAGANLANLYPAPNLPGTANNYVYIPQRTYSFDDGDVKIDHYASEKTWFTLRASGGRLNGYEPSALPLPAVGAGPSFPGPQRQPHFQAHFALTRVFTSHFINEFRAGFSRLDMLYTSPTASTPNFATQLGIPGINVANDPNTYGNISSATVSGFVGLGDAVLIPGNVVTDNNQFGDIVTWDHGKHVIKAGFEFLRRRYNTFQASAPRGSFTFAPYYSRNPATGLEGNGLADLLLGLPQAMSLSIVQGTRGIRRSEYSAFVQDTWKITPTVTINLGLRYDFYPNRTGVEVNNKMAQFLPSTGKLYTVGSSEVPSKSGTNNSFLNFSPRVGFSYSPNPAFVLHGSYGIYYSPLYMTLSQTLAFNPPFIGTESYTNSTTNLAGARKISDGFTRTYNQTGIGSALNAVATNISTPYNNLWNLGIQQQLPGGFVLSVDYVGSRTLHLLFLYNINAVAPGPGDAASRRRYPSFADINMADTTGYGTYHAGQATLARRFAKNLQLSESYTYSHCLNVPQSGVQNPFNKRGDYANCDWDLRHRSVTTVSYLLPFGRGQHFLGNVNRLTDAVIGGWKLNAIVNWYTGFYFTPTNAANTSNSPSIPQRPNLVAGCDLYANAHRPTRWFNPSCYTSPALYTLGNAGRNSLLGPSTKYADMSLFKTINVTADGRARVQFEAQVFNITNTPQLNNPGAAIGTPTAGVISSAGSDVTFARTSRQMQIGVHVDF